MGNATASLGFMVLTVLLPLAPTSARGLGIATANSCAASVTHFTLVMIVAFCGARMTVQPMAIVITEHAIVPLGMVVMIALWVRVVTTAMDMVVVLITTVSARADGKGTTAPFAVALMAVLAMGLVSTELATASWATQDLTACQGHVRMIVPGTANVLIPTASHARVRLVGQDMIVV